jgi:steroid Delta-isomerase
MPDADHIRRVLTSYPELLSKGDVEGIVALYREDATIEDPIGTPEKAGRAAIRAFYAASAGKVAMRLTGPVRVAGREAAAPLAVLVGPPGQQQVIDIIDVMEFDDDGLVVSMRAFWSPDAIRPATPADLG